MGETALHLLCLHNTPMHSDIARIMLKLYPKMAADIYEGDEYYGKPCLLSTSGNGRDVSNGMTSAVTSAMEKKSRLK